MTQRYFLTAEEIDQIAQRVVEVQLAELERLRALPFRPWMHQFLRDLERTHASRAIQLCPYSRDTVYRYRRGCPAFRLLWEGIAEAKRTARERSGRRRRSHTASQKRVSSST